MPEKPSPVAADHRATEEVLLDSGLDWSFLRNSIYAEYQVPTASQAIASGRHVHNSGDVGVSFVSRVDCAAAAAGALAGTARSGAQHREPRARRPDGFRRDRRRWRRGAQRAPSAHVRDVLTAHRDELVAR